MTECGIFKILLENNENDDYVYDFPKLQPVAADIIAEKLTDIIYETLKQKSTASHGKRRNILNFIHKTCEVTDCHLSEDSYDCFLKVLRKSLQSNAGENNDVSKFMVMINGELEDEIETNLTDIVVNFYKRNSLKEKKKLKKLEYMNEMVQEKLDSKFDLPVLSNVYFKEINESAIRDLIGNSGKKSTLSELKHVNVPHTSTDYREKQIKFCFALLNYKNKDLCLINKILQRLSSYKELEEFEENFLLYLWLHEDSFASIVSDKFSFVFEKLILNYATEILSMKNDVDVYQYFKKLESHGKLVRLKKFCQENTLLDRTLKSLVYELYFKNFRNENILQLLNFLQ